MPAYMILTRKKTRISAELETYDRLVPATFAGHDKAILVRHVRHEVLKGPDTEDVMVISFPTLEAAKAWHGSPHYQEAATHRYRGGDFRCIVVEGV